MAAREQTPAESPTSQPQSLACYLVMQSRNSLKNSMAGWSIQLGLMSSWTGQLCPMQPSRLIPYTGYLHSLAPSMQQTGIEGKGQPGGRGHAMKAVMNCIASPSNLNEVEKQLKDALEKNQQWLVYDQQREAYVMGLLARIFELEQQSETVNQQQAREATAEGYLQEEKQKYYDQLLLTAKNDLDTERQTITQLRSELNEFKKKYEETKQEVMSLNSVLQSQYNVATRTLEDEKKIKGDKIQRLKEENEITREKLKEEKKKTEDLLSQVQFLHKSLLKQQEEHTRIALLEQQIQMCTTDFENEKLDRQNLQHQLNKVLKELRKAREQITRLEPLKLQEFGHTEPSNGLQAAFEDMLTIKDKNPSLKRSNLLDESFLECPKCKVQYPTSQHRELLAHIDFCAD
ncbi:centrosomal protein of 55 kDa isoform X2 [Chelonia mydas]|uniref:centrosomal protein of 55 kDa isoform X2 n=1 Tax=Chelonia mydas TaxID=8469 RepID=UPI001CA9EE43|nr:centrosomal protein of 55 kDa isoform X2 [Chelonia mydas]